MSESSDRPVVSVVVVSYQTRDLTLAALDSVAPALDGLRGEIIVVDNASDDGSPAAIAAAHPDVDLIALPENIGFARAVNMGAAHARGDYILLLNPDAVAQAGAIRSLVCAAQRSPAAGLWGGQVVDSEGRPDPGAARGLPSLWSLACFAAGLTNIGKGTRLFDPESLGHWDRTASREVGYLTGCFLLTHTSVWRALHGFDERYFMYSEDADLAARARRLGYAPRFCPDGTVVHVSGGSTARPDKWVLVLKGKVTFLRQHWSAPAAQVGVGLLLIGTVTRAIAAAVASRVGRRSMRHWTEVWRRRDEWRMGYPPH